jgi:uncharacterized protein YecE (DUF72 family)
VRGAVLKEYLIGTGGWAYFQVPGLHPLVAYAKAFNFVEVNSTFYQIPPIKEVETWRKLVPASFKFAVRAHRAITHAHKLQPTEEALGAFEKMRQVCRVLDADVLHLQTPPSFKPTQTSISSLWDFLSSIDLGKLRLALEIRGASSTKLPTDLVRTMQQYDVIHSVDLSKGETPAYQSDTLYSRLFGKGEHNIYQPTDGELQEIDNRTSKGNFERVVMSFHFVRMYKDAARLKIYKETGKFPTVTRATGLESLEQVLEEDTKLPSTKQELVQSQGWKLFDLTKEERVRVEEFLQKLPDRTYNNVGEIMNALRPFEG